MAFDPQDIFAKKGILRLGGQGRVRYALWEKGQARLYEGSPFSGGAPGKEKVKLKDLHVLAPCRPSKIVAVGLNYKGHAQEMKKELPQEPMLFLKPGTSVIGPGAAIVRPTHMSQRVDYEAELGVVIGRTCHGVSVADAPAHVLGYTCLNDVTARDLQARDGQFTRGKGFDTFCPIGPVIALDLDPGDLRVQSLVNGQARQDSRTSDLIFSVAELVSFISRVMTLKPGDVIATGTPAGIGPVVDGDVVTIAVEGIGRLSNPVISRG
ncbi:MAG: fumarylacetoacetate hydrolase family protein [Desulfarculus sp.]|nr:fumarylacetoacetate hydrolase family protein [Desulfarculus sp.]